jgi:RNA methyltransferase, TrmH family
MGGLVTGILHPCMCLTLHARGFSSQEILGPCRQRQKYSNNGIIAAAGPIVASTYREPNEAPRERQGNRKHGIIRSQNNQKVKHCVKLLKSKSYREEHGKVMLCGARVVEELGPYFPEISSLFYIGAFDEDEMLDHHSPYMRGLLGLDDEGLEGNSGITFKVSKQVMEKLCNVTTASPNMVAVEVDMPEYQDFSSYEPGTIQRLLVLERCQDPGNLGALLRSAVAFGFDGVILLPGCADPFGDKSIRASRGASFRIPMMVCKDIAEWQFVCERHGLIALAADVLTDDAKEVSSQGPAKLVNNVHVSLVVGSEGQGLSHEMRRHCRLVSIPMSDDMESLNVATAASILMCFLSPNGTALQHRLIDALLTH